jgi:hypothetical protein
MSYKGKYKPKNPEKYNGNVKKITYRSLWERKFMKYCDNHPSIVSWSSEELAVPYMSPVDRKQHRYFPDFIVEMRTYDHTIKTIMVEVKPLAQTKVLSAQHFLAETHWKRRRRKLKEFLTYKVNHAKWAAAKVFCARHNWEFRILTEKELKIK